MGQRDLRALLVTGAMAVFQQARLKPRAASPWLQRMMATKPPKVVALALANKMARVRRQKWIGRTTAQAATGDTGVPPVIRIRFEPSPWPGSRSHAEPTDHE